MSGTGNTSGPRHLLLAAAAVAISFACSATAAQSPDYATQITAARQRAAQIRPIWFDAVIAADDPDFRKRARGGSPITVYAARLLVTEIHSGRPQLKDRLHGIQTTLTLAALATHDEILSIVLQHAYFGRGGYGHDTAARRYFLKGANELSLSEVATLTGFLTAPTRLSSNTELALKRRNFVLQRMHAAGAISDEDLQNALTEPLTLSR